MGIKQKCCLPPYLSELFRAGLKRVVIYGLQASDVAAIYLKFYHKTALELFALTWKNDADLYKAVSLSTIVFGQMGSVITIILQF